MTAKTVLYYATRWGYSVTAYDADMQPVDEYRAGNHPLDSQGVVTPQKRYEPGDVHPMSLRTLRKFAKQTALEMAQEYGVPADCVAYDDDGEESEIEERNLLSAGS